ncbi:MAG: hypothetical protein ACJ8HI_00155 [Massilia sp.]
MADATPTMEAGTAQAAASHTSAPTQQPPASIDAALRSRPVASSEPAALRAPPGAAQLHSAPTLPSSGGGAKGVAAWQNSKQVDALWSINQDRNSWVGIAGIGWKKLSGPSESAAVALTMLMSHARGTGSPVTYRDESDNLIHEVYVW